MHHFFDMLTFDFLLKPPQPFTGLFLPAGSSFGNRLCRPLKGFANFCLVTVDFVIRVFHKHTPLALFVSCDVSKSEIRGQWV